MVHVPFKHNIYDNVPVPPFITAERMLEIQTDHVSRKDDIYIATYQKSGTTWLQHILNKLLDEPQGKTDQINHAVPWLEEESQETIDKMKSPRIMKTHDKWEWIPKGEGVKYIYCYRNAKDVCCSYYHHMLTFHGHYEYSGSLEEFFKDIYTLPDCSENGFYFYHITSWLKQLNNPNILFLTFEDMVEDLSREITKIVQFLEITVSKEKLKSITESSMFDSMAKNPHVNYQWRDGSKKDPNRKFIRKGKVGGWMDELNDEQSAELERLTNELIEKPFGIKVRFQL